MAGCTGVLCVDSDAQLIYNYQNLFTWSNECDNPTLERLDCAFASVHWMEQHQNHMLHCLSSDSSDYAPLLLIQNSEPWAKPRFCFEVIWTKFDGFVDVVRLRPPDPFFHDDGGEDEQATCAARSMEEEIGGAGHQQR